uniref:trypsin n=1 Tax=Sphaeramia orbicularis TaxID=375764 RepID=A0A673BS42_9TELE
MQPIFLYFPLCVVGQDFAAADVRVIGGYAPVPHSLKYIVTLQTRLRQHLSDFFCSFHLLLKNNMVIVAGDYSLSIYEGTEQEVFPQVLIPHPEYDSNTYNNDIMLIKLQVPVYLNSFVSITLMPRPNAIISEGRTCRVSGWGNTEPSGGQIPSTLRTVKVPIISLEKCNSTDSFNGTITENMLCAGFSTGGKDACQGDSGGPLVCDGRLYGVVSWGKGCAEPNFPGVYTAVAKYRKWIDNTIFSFYRRCDKV